MMIMGRRLVLSIALDCLGAQAEMREGCKPADDPLKRQGLQMMDEVSK